MTKKKNPEISRAFTIGPELITDSQKGSFEESYHGPESDSTSESAGFFRGIRSIILTQNHDTIHIKNHGDSQMASAQFSPKITFISDQRDFSAIYFQNP